jgi:hypothetical protein
VTDEGLEEGVGEYRYRYRVNDGVAAEGVEGVGHVEADVCELGV